MASSSLCAVCGAVLSRSQRGRAPSYCSPACRQRSYRDRQAELRDVVADLRRRLERLEDAEARRDGRVHEVTDPKRLAELRAMVAGEKRVERR